MKCGTNPFFPKVCPLVNELKKARLKKFHCSQKGKTKQ
jgi:hypothetical protein